MNNLPVHTKLQVLAKTGLSWVVLSASEKFYLPLLAKALRKGLTIVDQQKI